MSEAERIVRTITGQSDQVTTLICIAKVWD